MRMLKIPEKLKIWFEVRKKYKLSDAQIQMARELGLNPKKFGSLANSNQESWKLPLPQFIEKIYFKNFGREKPTEVFSLEEKVKKEILKKKNKKTEKQIQIPEEIKNKIEKIVFEKAKESDRELTIEIKGCFVYLYDDDSPLCRMKYLGEKEIWGFAIYKYSDNCYSTNEFGFPSQDTFPDCVETALRAYR